MADKVHPTTNTNSPTPSEIINPQTPNPAYVIQVPKDQIFRVPPPENAHKYKLYTRRAERRRKRGCCCFFTWVFGILITVAVSVGIAVGVVYFLFRPKLPSYSVESLAVSGLDVASLATVLSPKFDVTVKATNPNEKIGIYYKKRRDDIRVVYSDVELAAGEWPAFFHGKKNTTVVRTGLVGSKVGLSTKNRKDLTADIKRKAVPLKILVDLPIRVKFGAITTWTFTVKTRCEIMVDGLGSTANINDRSKKCVYRVNPFS